MPKDTLATSATAGKRAIKRQIPKKTAEDKWSVEHLLQDPNSELVDADLKRVLPAYYAMLPQEDRDELASLLPECDANNPDPIGVNNYVFWNALKDWQTLIAAGHFSKEKNTSDAEQDTTEQDDWKDDRFEAYWGERLERERKQRLREEEVQVNLAQRSRGCGRGRGRGLGRGQGRGRGRGLGRGRGRGRGRGQGQSDTLRQMNETREDANNDTLDDKSVEHVNKGSVQSDIKPVPPETTLTPRRRGRPPGRGKKKSTTSRK